jgi:hypothetical protein
MDDRCAGGLGRKHVLKEDEQEAGEGAANDSGTAPRSRKRKAVDATQAFPYHHSPWYWRSLAAVSAAHREACLD